MSETFTFTIISPKHGTFTVTAPLRFRAEIERHTWHVHRDPTRAEGRQFGVRTWVPDATKRSRRQRDLHLHRLIWELAGNPPAKAIDHIDGHPLNNAEDNLRPDRNGGNAQNRKVQRNNTSGVTGVHWNKRHEKWHARIKCEGKRLHLGSFYSKVDAQHARDIAALKLHKDFAVLNKPSNDVLTPEEYRAILECFIQTPPANDNGTQWAEEAYQK